MVLLGGWSGWERGSLERTAGQPEDDVPAPKYSPPPPSPLSACACLEFHLRDDAPGGLIIQDGGLGTWGERHRTCFLPQSPHSASLGRVRDFQLIETIPGERGYWTPGTGQLLLHPLEFGPALFSSSGGSQSGRALWESESPC